MFKYGVFSGPYFPAFGLNTGKNGPEKTQYLDIFSRSVDKYLFSANVCRRYVTELRNPEILSLFNNTKTLELRNSGI